MKFLINLLRISIYHYVSWRSILHVAFVAFLSKLPYAVTVAFVELFLVDPIELVVVSAFAVTGATVTSSGIFSPALPRAAGMPITIAAAITK